MFWPLMHFLDIFREWRIHKTCLPLIRNNHGEDHPDIDPLDVRGGQDRSRDSDEAVIGSNGDFWSCGFESEVELLSKEMASFWSIIHAYIHAFVNLQRGKNKKHCKMDLDHQIRELVSKYLGDQTVHSKKCKTSCQIRCTIELHRDPISKALSEW